MFVGNLWILVRSWLYKQPAYPMRVVAQVGDLPVGGVKIFYYPGPQDNCILVRPDPDTSVAYSQVCTHLSCAASYAPAQRRLECPCHEGYYPIRERLSTTGSTGAHTAACAVGAKGSILW